jgi:CubicO group peptidase (beta-lactamase class C family)
MRYKRAVAFPFSRTCRVPDSLESVTAIRAENEVDPRSVGVDRAAVQRVWEAVEHYYRSGIHPAIQLCVRRKGSILLDRAIGHASGNGPDDAPDTEKTPCTPETPFCALSASKPVTAMVIHLLDEQNYLRVDDPVAEYIPEFGSHSKKWITIRHVLAHRAGIPSIPARARAAELLTHRERIIEILCEARPETRPGRQVAYHAITGGFLLGEIAQRVTGRTISQILDKDVRRKLGCHWFTYGVKKRDVSKVARAYFTGLPPFPPLSTLLDRAIGLPFREAAELANDPRFLTAEVPSGNLVATAEEMTRFFHTLIDGGQWRGKRLFEPRTIFRAVSEQSYFELDYSLGLPLRYSMGFMLGGRWLSPFGPDTSHAFGHLGLSNIVAWADPDRDLAVALMTSGKPLIYPELYSAFDLLRQINALCEKKRP